MRRRLIEAALLVFAEKGVDACVVDDVIQAAGVSRGSFYNYFTSNQELLVAVGRALDDELLDLIEVQVKDAACDPAERVVRGVALFLEATRQYPLFAAFTQKVGLDGPGLNARVPGYIAESLTAGRAYGQFADIPPAEATDLVTGAVLANLTRCARDGSAPAAEPPSHVALVTLILQGLGLDPASARAYAARPIPAIRLTRDSLLERTRRFAHT